MRANRSIRRSTVIPVLVNPHVREAVDWLVAAFGFRERLFIGEKHRAQLTFGDGAVIMAERRDDRVSPRRGGMRQSVTVRVEDVNAHCQRVRAHDARILMAPTDQPFGERHFDPQAEASGKVGNSP